jgi:outer membrane lipoprotein carrier protein
MTRIPALVLIILALTFPRFALADEAADLAARIQKVYEDHKDFAAEFTQEVQRPHLPDRPLKKRGRVYFKKPGLMRWDYLEPDKVYYVSDGELLWNYIPESALVYKLIIKDSELFWALRFLYGEGDLSKDFSLSTGKPERGLKRLILKPNTGEHNFKRIELLIDPKSFEIKETIVVDPADNTSRVIFGKVSYKSLPDKNFRFKPPKGVRVEDLSKPAAKPD